jgi:hypothetical protein
LVRSVGERLAEEVYAGDGIDILLLTWKPAPSSGDKESDEKDRNKHNEGLIAGLK